MQNWESIINEHGPMVWKMAYRLLGNYQDAQDCFQETFISALEVSKSQKVLNLRALLARIVSVRSIDRLRRRYRCDGFSEVNFEMLASKGPGPDSQAHAAELAEQLRRALAQLPALEAEIFCLRCLNELSYAQIAELTGIAKGTVGVMLHRIKQRLREILENDGLNETRYNHES